MNYYYSRRNFLKKSAIAGAAALTLPRMLLGTMPAGIPSVDLWVLHGSDKAGLMRKALEIIFANGGLGSHVDTLTLKVNAAWTRLPEEGANTHPDLVETFLKGCRDSGVKKLLLPEHPCHSAEQSFTRSGIRDAARKVGAEMIDLKRTKKSFRDIDIDQGVKLRKVQVAREFMETDCLVNMPVAKHHGGATLSIAMKNWMGAVNDRFYWHRNNLHQCIADFAPVLRPRWTLVDATRIMPDNGPQGPSANLRHPELLILSKDQVAADSYTATLFHESYEKVRYIGLAAKSGAGIADPSHMNIHQMEVS